LRRSLQFARIITVLTVVLGFRAYSARAQHAASSFSASSSSQARGAAPQISVSAPHTSVTPAIRAAGNGQSFRGCPRHSSPILASGSKFPPTNRPRPVKPVPVRGFYWIFDGGAYWVPAQGDTAADQSPADQASMDQISGGQSVDSGQIGSAGVNASGVSGSLQQNSADGTGSAGDDSVASASEAREEAAYLPDEGQFTLVLNDGRWIEAVAFTHSNDTIVYITTAGSRYTIAANELDWDSTLRVNQERGTPLQSPL
jgi:hypothetical protein